MAQTNNVHTSAEMATSQSFTNSFQGFQTSNYTTKIQSFQDIMYLDGKSIFSDGALSIGTSTNNNGGQPQINFSEAPFIPSR